MNPKYIEADIINSFIEEEISEEVKENSLNIVRNIKNFLYLVDYICVTSTKTIEIEFRPSLFDKDGFFLEIGKKEIGFWSEGYFQTFKQLYITEDNFEDLIRIINLNLFKTFHKEKLLIEKSKFINIENLFN